MHGVTGLMPPCAFNPSAGSRRARARVRPGAGRIASAQPALQQGGSPPGWSHCHTGNVPESTDADRTRQRDDVPPYAVRSRLRRPSTDPFDRHPSPRPWRQGAAVPCLRSEPAPNTGISIAANTYTYLISNSVPPIIDAKTITRYNMRKLNFLRSRRVAFR